MAAMPLRRWPFPRQEQSRAGGKAQQQQQQASSQRGEEKCSQRGPRRRAWALDKGQAAQCMSRSCASCCETNAPMLLSALGPAAAVGARSSPTRNSRAKCSLFPCFECAPATCERTHVRTYVFFVYLYIRRRRTCARTHARTYAST